MAEYLEGYPGAKFLPIDKHDTYPAIDPAKADLSGKVVVITGASRSIGRATAIAIAQSGARGLVLLARSGPGLEAVKEQCLAAQRPGHPLEVVAVQTDVSSNDQVIAAAKRVEDTFGRVDVIINNVGILEHYNFIADSDPDDWWKAWEVNMRGTYQVTRAFLPLLIKCGGDKTIVDVSSASAHEYLPRYSAYSTSKLAMLRFNEFVNVEYGDKGVLAYAIHPGVIWTDQSTGLPPEFQAAPVFIDTLELAAHTLLWLVKERREWLAGRYVDCRWDMEALAARKQEVVDGDKLKVKLVV